jgi:beta-glucosidase
MARPKTFPDGFLWGSASSAHQIEGNNDRSDWWAHELAPDTNAAEPSGMACDSYNRFVDDWRLLANSGQNAVRLSVEWARIEPYPGEFDNEQLDHYREVVGSARELGLETFVTLHHFTNPQWFADGGGWLVDESVDMFARYARTVTEALSDLLETVNTINEPQVVAAAGYAIGYFPPRKSDIGLAHKVTANLIKAHAQAVGAVRDRSSAKVGIALSINDHLSVNDEPESVSFRNFIHHSMVGVYLDALMEGKITGLQVPDEEVGGLDGSDDLIGIQYYTKFVADPALLADPEQTLRPKAEEGERVTQMGWVWHPEGFGKVIDEVASTGLPIYITENGIATDDDSERISYVNLHLDQVHAAIERGADARGYFYWSYLDNFEWNEGYRPKFGLIGVDRTTFERTPKPSLDWYGSVAKQNAI